MLHNLISFLLHVTAYLIWIGKNNMSSSWISYCLTLKDFPPSVFLICVFGILSWGQQELWDWFNCGGVKQDEKKKLFSYSQTLLSLLFSLSSHSLLSLLFLWVSNSTLLYSFLDYVHSFSFASQTLPKSAIVRNFKTLLFLEWFFFYNS